MCAGELDGSRGASGALISLFDMFDINFHRSSFWCCANADIFFCVDGGSSKRTDLVCVRGEVRGSNSIHSFPRNQGQ